MSVKKLMVKSGGIDFDAYRPYRIKREEITRIKRKLAKEIIEVVTPYMWRTGYCKEFRSEHDWDPIMAFFFTFSDKRKSAGKDYYKVGNMDVIGFSEDGVCNDAYAGGLASTKLVDLYIEELYKLHVFVLNRKEFRTKVKQKI